MWSDFSGKAYSKADIGKRIEELKWTTWKPIGITLHNTAAPTLAQWAESGLNHAARIRNLQSYYERLGWSGGPHWFISREWFNEFSNPLRRGVHSPGFNAGYLGIEMVGDFSREPFSTGDGAKVRDNSVHLMALLCNKFGFDPVKDIKLHKEDPRTDHDCPGKLVNKADVIARVVAEMARLKGEAPAPAPVPPPPTAPSDLSKRVFKDITATVFADSVIAYQDVRPGWNDRAGVALPLRFKGHRPKVKVTFKGKSVTCDIIDVGPWNIADEYWLTEAGRPRVEAQFKNKTPDFKGRIPKNDAGIDLTPFAAKAIGLPGKGKVDWEFIN